MTDKQIIKAFKRCYLSDEINCGNCAFTNCPPNSCITEMTKSVFELINRQKAEIERLSCRLSDLIVIEKEYALKYGNNHDVEIVKKDVRRNAIREFAEKIKDYCNEIANQEWNKKTSPVSWSDAYEDFIDDIDNLVKEMTEESNDQQKT